jgi:poly(3-hydroxybutyrate) depolymerase
MQRRYSTLLAVAVWLSLISAPATWAQPRELVSSATTERIEARSYHFAEAGQEVTYELYVPTSYDAAVPAPLVVALHGLGSTPSAVIRYQGLTDLAEERGYVVVAPMGYNTRGWYGSRGPGRASTSGDAANDPENLGELSEMDVMNVLRITLDELNIDADRIFLMGHSMGGGGTWHLGMRHPDLWAGLAPVAPAIYSSPDALEAITHIPVFVLMGDADRLVNVEVTRQWVAKMEELGMEYVYLEIPDGDHTALIARDPGNMEQIFDFFDRARRN